MLCWGILKSRKQLGARRHQGEDHEKIKGLHPLQPCGQMGILFTCLSKSGLLVDTKATAALPVLVVSPDTWPSKVAFTNSCTFSIWYHPGVPYVKHGDYTCCLLRELWRSTWCHKWDPVQFVRWKTKLPLFWLFTPNHYDILDFTAHSNMAVLTECRLGGPDGEHRSVGGACRHLASSLLSLTAQSILLCAQEALGVELILLYLSGERCSPSVECERRRLRIGAALCYNILLIWLGLFWHLELWRQRPLPAIPQCPGKGLAHRKDLINIWVSE